MTAAYAWAWPGQPGGHEPVVADKMIQARGQMGNIVLTPNHQKAKQKRPGTRSMRGVSKKADAAAAQYEAEAKRHAAE